MAAPWMPRELPREVRYGIEIVPAWDVDIARLPDGREFPNLVSAQSRHEYTLSIHTDTPQAYALAKGHWMQARGMLFHWPFRDPLDNAATLAEGVIVQTAQGYRLAKRYGEGAGPQLRTISRPVGATLYQADVPAEGITIDADTGYLVGVPDEGIDVAEFSWQGGFRVPVRYDMKGFPSRFQTRRQGGDPWVMVDGILVVEVPE